MFEALLQNYQNKEEVPTKLLLKYETNMLKF